VIAELDILVARALQAERPGAYVELTGRPGQVIDAEKFDKSGLRLLNVQQSDGADTAGTAVFYAPTAALGALRRKVVAFEDQNTETGRPKNADLVQSIGRLDRARLRTLWRGPPAAFPIGLDRVLDWEVWLTSEEADRFAAGAGEAGVHVAADRLIFPEQTVLQVTANRRDLAALIRGSSGVTALAKPSTTAAFFDGLPVTEQPSWSAELLSRRNFATVADAEAWITLLDTGVTRAHPLVQPALAAADRHAADPAWGLEDVDGHGTGMAGLALFGDLTTALSATNTLTLRHRLESVKVIPDAGLNPHHLLGAVTRRGIDAAETSGERRRVFTLASSTPDDHPHDGAPTSWSVELDQLTAGVSGLARNSRLVVTAAGNVKAERHVSPAYHLVNDSADEELQAPGQAWNVITVGAFTDKVALGPNMHGVPLAPAGDLSPFSKTASWNDTWPIKPDIVMEGGNLHLDDCPPALACQDLSLLTTYNEPAARHFATFEATSAATALAARMAAMIWSDYPQGWPETIRALLVSSGRWTPTMLAHLPNNPSKTAYERLFRRYGYGVPDLRRARRSALDAVTLVVQDELVPYAHSASKNSPAVLNHMKLHTLPWPRERLRALGNRMVTLRVGLSTFIEPNPAEAARGRKLQYGSHGLRFKLNRANESASSFERRINKAAADRELYDASGEEEDGWTFGPQRRSVGSLHIDELTCRASDLARRNFLAVYPVGGWWKSSLKTGEQPRAARYALVIDIDAQGSEIDLYAEVEAAIRVQVAAAAAVTV
jgi:hypothetical protein